MFLNQTAGFYHHLSLFSDHDLANAYLWAQLWLRNDGAGENTRRIYVVCKYIMRQRGI